MINKDYIEDHCDHNEAHQIPDDDGETCIYCGEVFDERKKKWINEDEYLESCPYCDEILERRER